MNCKELLRKIGRASEQNRQTFEELQQRKMGNLWSRFGSGLVGCILQFVKSAELNTGYVYVTVSGFSSTGMQEKGKLHERELTK